MQTTIRWALCILGIEGILLICLRAGLLSLAPPLTASCLLLSANPQGIFARPRTTLVAYVAIGHLSLLNSVFFGNALMGILAMTLLGVCLMALIPCVHPPAIGLPFLMAQTPSPFRLYFVLLGLAGGMLLLHAASQWLMDQLYKPEPARSTQTNLSESTGLGNISTGAGNDSTQFSNPTHQTGLQTNDPLPLM